MIKKLPRSAKCCCLRSTLWISVLLLALENWISSFLSLALFFLLSNCKSVRIHTPRKYQITAYTTCILKWWWCECERQLAYHCQIPFKGNCLGHSCKDWPLYLCVQGWCCQTWRGILHLAKDQVNRIVPDLVCCISVAGIVCTTAINVRNCTWEVIKKVCKFRCGCLIHVDLNASSILIHPSVLKRLCCEFLASMHIWMCIIASLASSEPFVCKSQRFVRVVRFVSYEKNRKQLSLCARLRKRCTRQQRMTGPITAVESDIRAESSSENSWDESGLSAGFTNRSGFDSNCFNNRISNPFPCKTQDGMYHAAH